MDAEGLADGPAEVGQVLDEPVARDPAPGRRGVQLGAQPRVHAGRARRPEEEGARRVARRVAAGDQLRQRLRRQLRPPHRLPVLVPALHQPREQVPPRGLGPAAFLLQPRAHPRDGDAGEVVHRSQAAREERVRDVRSVGLQRGERAERVGDLAASVEDLHGGSVARRAGRRLAHLGDVGARVDHAEGGAEGEVPDDVEGQVVEPLQAVDGGPAGAALGGRLAEAVPLPDQVRQVAADVLLELADAAGAEGVRDHLALARVLVPVPRVEEAALDGDEGVVVLRFQEAVAVPVDDGDGVGRGDGNVVRLDAHEGAVFLVGAVDGEVAAAESGLVEEPEVGECCSRRTGDGSDAPVP